MPWNWKLREYASEFLTNIIRFCKIKQRKCVAKYQFSEIQIIIVGHWSTSASPIVLGPSNWAQDDHELEPVRIFAYVSACACILNAATQCFWVSHICQEMSTLQKCACYLVEGGREAQWKKPAHTCIPIHRAWILEELCSCLPSRPGEAVRVCTEQVLSSVSHIRGESKCSSASLTLTNRCVFVWLERRPRSLLSQFLSTETNKKVNGN